MSTRLAGISRASPFACYPGVIPSGARDLLFCRVNEECRGTESSCLRLDLKGDVSPPNHGQSILRLHSCQSFSCAIYRHDK